MYKLQVGKALGLLLLLTNCGEKNHNVVGTWYSNHNDSLYYEVIFTESSVFVYYETASLTGFDYRLQDGIIYELNVKGDYPVGELKWINPQEFEISRPLINLPPKRSMVKYHRITTEVDTNWIYAIEPIQNYDAQFLERKKRFGGRREAH